MKIRSTLNVMATAVGLLTLVVASSLAAQTSPICGDGRLPPAVSELLKAKFPLWRPKRVSDLGADDRQLWLKAHSKECPGIAVGHFESADRLAYAVLLVPKTKAASGYKVIALSTSQSEDSYAMKVLNHAEGQAYPEIVISAAAPGRYGDFEDTKSMRIKLDSIYVEWIEKAALLYYWSDGRYHRLQTSD